MNKLLSVRSFKNHKIKVLSSLISSLTLFPQAVQGGHIQRRERFQVFLNDFNWRRKTLKPHSVGQHLVPSAGREKCMIEVEIGSPSLPVFHFGAYANFGCWMRLIIMLAIPNYRFLSSSDVESSYEGNSAKNSLEKKAGWMIWYINHPSIKKTCTDLIIKMRGSTVYSEDFFLWKEGKYYNAF